MKRILILSGRQGSGKTSNTKGVADLARAEGFTPVFFKFADVIYEMHNACLPVLKKFGIRPDDMVKDGELLQVLGTEYGRNRISRDVWAKACRRNIDHFLMAYSNPGLAVIDDCRFENEFDLFPDAFKVRLDCAEDVRKARCSYWREDTAHPSETGLDDYERRGKFDLKWNTEYATRDVVSAGIWEGWKNS